MIAHMKDIIQFIGALGLFIYGMHIMALGLQKTAGGKMQSLLSTLTKNKFFGVLTGAFVTMVIQSSSATTVMVVGFVNAGLLTLTQSVGVIMGANIGTTVTSWLVAASEWSEFLKPTTIAPLMVAIGVVMTISSKKAKVKTMGEIFVGFGILFFGISQMSAAVAPLKDSPAFISAFSELGANPILGVLAGAVITCILQSSSASVGILQTVASTGVVPTSAAIYIILGQNIGTCITALLSSVGTSKTAKAAAYIHLLFNVIASFVVLIVVVIYFKMFNPALALAGIDVTQISIFHTSFNIIATLMLYPFSDLLVKGASKMAGLTAEETLGKPQKAHLDDRLLESPSIATASAFTEIIRLGDIALESLNQASLAIIDRDLNKVEIVEELEDEIDDLEDELTNFMAKTIRMELTDKDKDDVAGYFHVVSDIERIGDHCVNIADTATYLVNEDVYFSDIAVTELQDMLNMTNRCYVLSLKALRNKDLVAAEESMKIEDDIDNIVKDLRDNHIERLSNSECSPKSAITFLELLNNLERISDHSKNICEYVSATTNSK